MLFRECIVVGRDIAFAKHFVMLRASVMKEHRSDLRNEGQCNGFAAGPESTERRLCGSTRSALTGSPGGTSQRDGELKYPSLHPGW